MSHMTTETGLALSLVTIWLSLVEWRAVWIAYIYCENNSWKVKNNLERMKKEIMNRNELGGSLPVESVQALASKDLKDIPARYIRPELEFDVVYTDGSLKIPVIDLSRLLDQQFMYEEELKKLHSACEDWGFFQLINHGFPEEVVEQMKVDVEEFFKLPLEEKTAYSQLPGVVEGYGQALVVSEEQKLDWGDMLFLYTQPVADRNMTLWPKHPTSFRDTLDKYSSELQRVTVCLIGCMAKNLGVVDPKKWTSMFEIGWEGVRMNYYPPCVVNADKVLGISPHSDATALTLLIQVNEVQGLQIRNNGVWVPVEPIPGAFIVNIGDMIEIMSNGKYKSIEHRAMIDPLKERMSIAAFHSPDIETIGPLPEIVKMTGGEEKYKTLNLIEYLKLMYSTKLDGKNLLELMKLD